MTQIPFELDLRDLMDGHYGAGSWSYWNGTGSGTDIGPALTDGVAKIKAVPGSTGGGKIEFGPFKWLLQNPPADLGGIVVEGVSSVKSPVIVRMKSGVAFAFRSAGGGLRHLGIELEDGCGDTNTIGLLLEGDAASQNDQSEYRDIYMSAVGGTSFWWDGVHVDGTARMPPSAIGSRVSVMDNLQIFQCRNIGMYLSGAEQFTLSNIGLWTGKGAYANQLMITGTQQVPSSGITGTGIDAAGGINVAQGGLCVSVCINGKTYC